MVEIQLLYAGNLHCQAVHAPSGTALATDAPRDNHGLGQTFSPTDLVATGLGSCMATLMGIRSREHSWDLTGMRLRVRKHMTTTPPRRIAKLEVEIDVPATACNDLSTEDRALLEHAAHTCPVRLSILPAIEVPVVFRWGEEP